MPSNTMRHRSPRGNMIIFIAATLIGIIIALLAFGLNYVHILGGQQGQTTAIQAAALAAAQDLSRIVIDTPEFGYVSLSDSAPIGTATMPKAGDNYYLPVRSINTIIGTARLDYIIGTILKDPIMQGLALLDLTNAQHVATKELGPALTAAIQPNGSGTDANGNTVTPYADAVTAFTQNLKVTGAGTNCTYVNNSMKLTLGCLSQGVPTNTPVPQPATVAPVPAPLQQNGFYLSDTDVPYNGVDFTFASIGSSVRLVDQSQFTLSPTAPSPIPAIVQAAADQLVSNSQASSMQIHAIACAQPASVYDPLPAPGSLSFNFPDGPLPDIQTPVDVISQTNLSTLVVSTTAPAPKNTPIFANLLSATGGDYPTDTGATMKSMAWMLPGQPVMSDVWRAAYFDWLRRGGVKANISSVVSMQTTPFVPPSNYTANKDWITLTIESPAVPEDITKIAPGPQIPVGYMDVFKFNSDGTIAQSAVLCNPVQYQVQSENQMYAEAINANPSPVPILTFPNNGAGLSKKVKLKGKELIGSTLTFTQMFDVYVRDEVRQGGDINGGKHGGEPLEDSQVSSLPVHNNVCWAKKHGTCRGNDGGASGIGANPHTGGSGNGALPLLTIQSDFCELQPGDKIPAAAPPLYDQYQMGPAGGATRPTYTTNGSCVEIRFRRQIQISNTITLPSGLPLAENDMGYLFLEY